MFACKEEEELIQLKARVSLLEVMIRHASDGIVVLTKDKVIRFSNVAAQKMFDYSEDEMSGKNIDDIIFLSDLSDLHIGLFDNSLENWLEPIVKERMGRKSDGKMFTIELSIAALFHENSSMITLMLRDISERKSMERRLLQSEKMNSIGYLAAGVAHEINTPIQYVSNNIDFLRNEFKKLDNLLALHDELFKIAKRGEVSADLIAQIECERGEIDYLRKEIPIAISESIEGIDRVAEIVRSLKDFAHPGQDEKVFASINELIESTVIISRNTWKHVADIQLDLSNNIDEFPVYSGDLKQVILNLIVNAAQAIEEKCDLNTLEKGLIKISTTRERDRVKIDVYDTGVGIAPEHEKYIFEPFYTTKDVGRGTGQGLAISKRIICDKHKGTMEVESIPGNSTTFHICLPIVESV